MRPRPLPRAQLRRTQARGQRGAGWLRGVLRRPQPPRSRWRPALTLTLGCMAQPWRRLWSRQRGTVQLQAFQVHREAHQV